MLEMFNLLKYINNMYIYIVCDLIGYHQPGHQYQLINGDSKQKLSECRHCNNTIVYSNVDDLWHEYVDN